MSLVSVVGDASPAVAWEDVCGVVVAYKPDLGFADRVASFAEMVCHVVVVDNGGESTFASSLHRRVARASIDIITNSRNVGIAAALNQGVEWARRHGHRWVLTLDHDSVPLPTMVETLLRARAMFPEKSALAVVGSSYGKPSALGGGPDHGPHPVWCEVSDVITSGSLISVMAWEVIGPFRESFFIDHVDTEYCLRSRAKGFKVIAVHEPLMRHEIGRRSEHRFLWRRTSTTNHSPERRYHATRNLMVLAREYLVREPRWVLTTLGAWAKSVILICLYERDRSAKLRAIARGTLDGLSPRTRV